MYSVVMSSPRPPATSSAAATVGLAAVLFPIVIDGLVGGVLISLRVVGMRARMLALSVYPALSSLPSLDSCSAYWQGPFSSTRWLAGCLCSPRLRGSSAFPRVWARPTAY